MEQLIINALQLVQGSLHNPPSSCMNPRGEGSERLKAMLRLHHEGVANEGGFNASRIHGLLVQVG